jgi:hypothetical protein
MLEGFGSWVEIDVKGRATIQLEMGDKGGAKCGLQQERNH